MLDFKLSKRKRHMIFNIAFNATKEFIDKLHEKERLRKQREVELENEHTNEKRIETEEEHNSESRESRGDTDGEHNGDTDGDTDGNDT